jgi:futalosine hydrolase
MAQLSIKNRAPDQMKILLVAATEFEIRPLLIKMDRVKEHSEQLASYNFLGQSIDVLIPGIGMIVTAYHVGRQLHTSSYNLAINAGIAGTYANRVPVGAVVEIMEETMSELGAEEEDRMVSVFELGLMDPDAFPFKKGLLVNEKPLKLHSLAKFKKVRGNTVSMIRGSKEGALQSRKFADADTESMEGAAFFYSCLASQVPFTQIRAISNLVEERDKSAWNVPLALKHLNNALQSVIEELAHTEL